MEVRPFPVLFYFENIHNLAGEDLLTEAPGGITMDNS